MEQMSKCKQCDEEFLSKKGKIFCSKKCREKNWAKENRESLNQNVREYRKRRYQVEGRWREEGAKAKELKEWMIELKSKPCSDCGGIFPICCMDFDHTEGTVI